VFVRGTTHPEARTGSNREFRCGSLTLPGTEPGPLSECPVSGVAGRIVRPAQAMSSRADADAAGREPRHRAGLSAGGFPVHRRGGHRYTSVNSRDRSGSMHE
jgi:hypothetical protein